MNSDFDRVIEGRVRTLRHNVNGYGYKCSLRYRDLSRNEKYIEFFSNTRIEAKSGDYFRLVIEKENNTTKVSFYNDTIGLYFNSASYQEEIIRIIMTAIFLLVYLYILYVIYIILWF
jgi:hypothetical protein